MSSTNASYDTLKIYVDVDSSNANRNISKLSSNLQKLNEKAKELDDKRLIEVKGLLQDIASIDFSNVSRGLQDVVNAFKAFNNRSFMKVTQMGSDLSGAYKLPSADEILGKQASGLNFKIDASVFKTMSNAMKEVKLDSDDFKVNIQQVRDLMPLTQTEQLAQELAQVGLTGEQVKTVLGAVDNQARKIDPSQIRGIEKALKQAGYSGKQIKKIISQIYKESKKKGFGEGLKDLIKHFKTILRQRILRKIIQDLYKMLTDGIKNVGVFDEKTGEAITSIKNSFLMLTNSIGALFSPLIQIVAPIIKELSTMLAGLANTFAEVFASANGQTTFAKAKTDLEGFNQEAKKTQALGIDELNVFQKEDDANEMFTQEQVNLGSDMQGFASSIKKLFEEIKQIVEKIKPILQDVVSKILPAIGNLLVPIMDIISVIVDLVMTLIGQTFSDVNSSLGNFIESLGGILKVVSAIINAVGMVLKPIIHIISSVINMINGVLGSVFKRLGDIANLLAPILNMANILLVPVSALLSIISSIFYIVEGVVKTIIQAITFDWGNIEKTWEDVGQKIKATWEDMGKMADKSWADAKQGFGDLTGFATGGFPEDGLFFANHNELVGQFSNGQTAVANNEQITQGIYEAVLQAMRESGNQGQDIVINLDGQELAKVVIKRQNNFGADLVLSGNMVWGK